MHVDFATILKDYDYHFFLLYGEYRKKKKRHLFYLTLKMRIEQNLHTNRITFVNLIYSHLETKMDSDLI